MSNCIQLHHHTVTFTEEELDIPAFEKFLAKYSPEKKPSATSVHPSQEEADYNLLWWFLGRNTRVNPDKSIAIEFGGGNSSHTWRDFRQTLWLINRFIIGPKSHEFLIADEYDGFDSVGALTIAWPYASWKDLYNAA